MEMYNAYEGIKQLVAGHICTIVYTICSFILLMAGYEGDVDDIFFFGNGYWFYVILTIVTVIAFFASMILKVMGTLKAGKTESYFINAFYMLVLIFICSIFAFGFFTDGLMASAGGIISELAALGYAIFIINGIANIADTLSNYVLYEKCQLIRNIVISAYVFSALVNNVGVLLDYTGNELIYSILEYAGNICSIVSSGCILYILIRAAKMLREFIERRERSSQYFR